MKAEELKGARVVVVGLGRTGEALARFLVQRGALVTATDIQDRARLADKIQDLEEIGVTLELGDHNLTTFLKADLIVVSPGVPMNIPPLAQARTKGCR
jgi:UDP-N-acetylmuramoylalanine--D-glutamate ligase